MKVRPILWFWLFAALVVFAGSVKAETMAPNIQETPRSMYYAGAPLWAYYSSLSTVCDTYGPIGYGASYGPWQPNIPNSSCESLGPARPYPGWGFTVTSGNVCADEGGPARSCGMVCDSSQGWTLQNGTCTRPDCEAGQIRDGNGWCRPACGTSGAVMGGNGICVCPQAAQRYNENTQTCGCDVADTSSYKGKGVSGTGSSSPSTVCNGGCTMTTGGLSVAAGGHWSTQIVAVTGSTCTATPSSPTPNQKTPTEDTRTPEQKCLASGGGFITLSSGTVCTTAGESPVPVVKTTIQEKTITTPTGTTTESTSTTCSGDQCTTTTTTKDGAGNVIGTTVTEGQSTGTGNGGGDGEPSECEQHPDRIGCTEKGTPTDGDALPTETRGVTSVTVQSFGSASSCPADVNLPKGAKLSYAYPCQMATTLRPLLLALAWLAAGFIVMGAFRDA